MVESIDLISDICDKIMKDFEGDINELSKNISNIAVQKIKDNDILINSQKAKLLIENRIISLVKSQIEFMFIINYNKKYLKTR